MIPNSYGLLGKTCCAVDLGGSYIGICEYPKVLLSIVEVFIVFMNRIQ
jgi:hypothetical protein